MRSSIRLMILLCVSSVPVVTQNPIHAAQNSQASTTSQSDSAAIRQIEADWLKGEETTDIAVLDRVLADDFVNIVPQGMGPGKAELISRLKPRAGQAPPYTLRTNDLRIHVFGDTAVVAFLKTYTQKENGSAANEETTHVFMKDHGVWKLIAARASLCPVEPAHP